MPSNSTTSANANYDVNSGVRLDAAPLHGSGHLDSSSGSMNDAASALAEQALAGHRGAVVVGLLQNGSALVGVAQCPDAGTRIEAQHAQFEIGSISKVFTGLLLAQAVEDGDLKLSDTLADLLGKQVAMEQRTGTVTLQQLVTHTSCLPRLPDDFFKGAVLADPYASYDRPRLWRAVADTTLFGLPPCAASYSNFGFAIIAELLAERYGKPWEALVRERITARIGMHDTLQHLDSQARHLQQQVSGFADGVETSAWHFGAFAGAGALRSTAHDMLLFSRAMIAGIRDGSGPLGRVAARAATPLGQFGGAQIGYGLLLRERDGTRTFYHDGATGGFQAHWQIAPGSGDAAVLLASSDQVDLALAVQPILTARYPARGTVIQVDAASLAAYAGVFRSVDAAFISCLLYQGQLYCSVHGGRFEPVNPVGIDQFISVAAGIEIDFERMGTPVTALRCRAGGLQLQAARAGVPPPVPFLPMAQLRPYLGRYRLDGGATFDVGAQAGQLTAKLSGQPRANVFPVTGRIDCFSYVGVDAKLQFERLETGEVSALLLHQNGRHRAMRIGNASGVVDKN